MNESTSATSTFTDAANEIRTHIKEDARIVLAMANSLKLPGAPNTEATRENRGEMIANLMLCYRHLEDASMRLGKALQAHDGGVSVYDRATTVGA